MALTLTSAEPARVRWIDALRGFIMILMVFGHVWAGIKNAGILTSGPVFEMTYSWICFFHMPTLFVLSGMLYSEPSYGRGLITENTRRVFRFLYPLVLWSYVYYTFKFIFADMVNTPVTLVEVLLGPLPPKDHFWFLWALFLIQLEASLLLAIFARLPGGRNNYAFGIVGLVIAVAMFYLPGIRTAWTAPAIGMAAFFFFGVLLSRFRLANMPINTASATIGLAVFAAVPTIVVAAGLQELDLIGVALQCFCILGLIAFAIWAGGRLGDNPAFGFLCKAGQASMAIYLLHLFFTSGVRILLQQLEIDDPPPHIAMGMLLGVLVPMAIHFSVNRPWLRKLLGI